MTNKPELLDRVNQTLDKLRPYLNTDGGDIELIDISEDYIATVKLLGSCSTCNMSHMTMKAGVEDGIRKAVPEIQRVIALEES
ncbi:MAG: NifU family protein [Bacteroidia bacterium]